MKGDNERSNIMKITIKDRSGGISQENLLETFKNLSFNSFNENIDY